MQEYKKVVYDDGDVCYYKPGTDILHREGGPAVEYANGGKVWYANNKMHRTDGPAVVRSNGDKIWYVDGKLHRTDGPAMEWADGSVDYYIKGRKYSEKAFLAKTAPVKEMNKSQLEKALGHPVKIVK